MVGNAVIEMSKLQLSAPGFTLFRQKLIDSDWCFPYTTDFWGYFVSKGNQPNPWSLYPLVAALDVAAVRVTTIFDRNYLNKKLFSEYIKSWHKERGVTSSISEITNCPSYRRIIGMGPDVAIPMILRQLKREGSKPDHWFDALETLTGVNPILEERYGNMVEMAKSWFEWAEKENVIW